MVTNRYSLQSQQGYAGHWIHWHTSIVRGLLVQDPSVERHSTKRGTTFHQVMIVALPYVSCRKRCMLLYVAVWDNQDRQKNRSVCTLIRSLLLCSLLLSITINLHRPGFAYQHHLLLFYWSFHTSSLYRDFRLASQYTFSYTGSCSSVSGSGCTHQLRASTHANRHNQ